MSIAVHGDSKVDEHFKELIQDANMTLNFINSINERVAEILKGEALNKTASTYFANQKKANLETAETVFRGFLVQIEKWMEVRNKQSSIWQVENQTTNQPEEGKDHE